MNFGPPMQPVLWHFLAIPFSVAAWILLLAFLISKLSGWSLLAQRFRAGEPWSGESWSWQSARFRGWCNYNRCLVFGANPEALYLSPMPLFRIFSPFSAPLRIPWNEIEVETGKVLFGWGETAQLRIGIQERVTLRIYGKLVGRLRQAAGTGWPLYLAEQAAAPPNYS
jgi:hypothetical protein